MGLKKILNNRKNPPASWGRPRPRPKWGVPQTGFPREAPQSFLDSYKRPNRKITGNFKLLDYILKKRGVFDVLTRLKKGKDFWGKTVVALTW